MYPFVLIFIASLLKIAENRMDISTLESEKDESQIAGAPSELRVHAGHDSVQVSWLPPRDDNVMIRGYQIGWGINIPDIEKATVDPTVRQYTIEGLKPSREYVVSLRAINNIGQGFPIYETVKTFSYNKIPTESPISNFDDDDLLTPVGLFAETLSSSQIRLSWVDPNEETFNHFYTIKYGMSGEINDQMKELNTTETEHIFEGLRPNSQFEFAVKLTNSQLWSLTATNRTFPAPPSSPPRDLTVVGPQSERDDPGTVTLNWQPPKYANGEIREYILFYTNNLDLPEREWIMKSVKGDRLSTQINELLPSTAYHFKLQARNIKGYGPFSSLGSFTTPQNNRDYDLTDRNSQIVIEGNSNATFFDHAIEMFSTNMTNILLGVVTIILLVLLVALIILCTQRQKSSGPNRKHSRPQQQNYMQGRKQSANFPMNEDDLWIQQNGGRFAALVNTSAGGGMVYEDFSLTSTANDSQRILLVDRQQRAFVSSGAGAQAAHLNSPIPHYQSHYAPPHHQANPGTMSRNYHNSLNANPNENLTPATPRNPHIVYARADRQPIAKVEFGHPSPSPFEEESDSFVEFRGFGSDKHDARLSPPLPTQDERASNVGGYQQVVNNPAAPMRSFSAVGRERVATAGEQNHQKIAHIVRPIVCVNAAAAANSSPSTIRNATGQPQQRTPPMIGQKLTAANNGKVPVGRATAQPRVNIAHSSELSASPYSSVRVQRDSRELNGSEVMMRNGGTIRPMEGEQMKMSQHRSNGSAEVLNVQEIDQMIDTLQQLQHEFTTSGET